MLLVIILLLIVLFYFTNLAFSSLSVKKETFLSESPVNDSHSSDQKKKDIPVIDTASQFLKHHSVLDKSIQYIFPDYTRPKDYPTTRTNFDQIDLYISNVPPGRSLNPHKDESFHIGSK